MLLLITYDISTQTPAGRKRLSQVAKQCQAYGQRVQNSVFECIVDHAESIQLKHKLTSLINPREDSLRFYMLGNRYETKVEHIGAKPSFQVEEPLII